VRNLLFAKFVEFFFVVRNFVWVQPYCETVMCVFVCMSYLWEIFSAVWRVDARERACVRREQRWRLRYRCNRRKNPPPTPLCDRCWACPACTPLRM